MERLRIGELLLQAKLITPERLEDALTLQRAQGRKLGQVLIDLGIVNETQLTQAEKLSSIGLLAAGVAHEVNTPLAVISSYAQMEVLYALPRAEALGRKLSEVFPASFVDEFHRVIRQARERQAAPLRCTFFDRFRTEWEKWSPADQPNLRIEVPPERIFAIFFQVRRAYAHIHECIIGASPAGRLLRARVWQSIFTRDMARYERALTGRMADLITLITGPSGSGKELVARAIGLSQFVPFDASRREFAEDYLRGFYPINLAALSPTLIESELFGHRRGAFTGALGDRLGYFEVCGPHGTVFLDEIGETDTGIQVKLLRVLQTRIFQRIGDTEPRTFAGKIVAATNRDLAGEMRAGRFREDMYYRLCADHVRTPALREILRDTPGELATLIRHIASRIAGPAEAPALIDEACTVLNRSLPVDYPWPGNFRELEQAVRNILVHGDYGPEIVSSFISTPAVRPDGQSLDGQAPQTIAAALEAGQCTADELLRRYVQRVYQLSGSYEEAARRLALDRRTVKKYVRVSSALN